MTFKNSTALRYTVGGLSAFSAAALILLFQNCSQVGFSKSEDVLESLSANSQTVYTALNTPKQFTAEFPSDAAGLRPTLESGGQSEMLMSGSTIDALDLSKKLFTYTPALGFRGNESTTIHLKDKYGNSTSTVINFVVANPLHELQPAMAIRTPGCISCHAQVASSFITDFGAGNDYFFAKSIIPLGQNPVQGAGESMYADRWDGQISWMSARFSSSIIVPKKTFDFDLGQQLQKLISGGLFSADWVPSANEIRKFSNPTNTLAEYVRAAEKMKPSSPYRHPSNEAGVIEKETVYIGAPSVALLKSRTNIGSARYQFYKDSKSSPDLMGVVDKGSYVEISNLTCDGDLVLTIPAYLNNLRLKTDVGCRIYSTQSIFVHGPVTYEQITARMPDLTNLQIVSAEWVNFGVGATHCETPSNPGWYNDNRGQSPVNMRLNVYGAPTRAAQTRSDRDALSQKLQIEQRLITDFKDASCDAGAHPRDVSYSRMLVNAPRVDSRYTGKFSGVLISEVALFGLSKFAYSYDPVFNAVPILPFLETADYLKVE